MSDERWLPVPGFEGIYEVSDRGRVRSLDRMVGGQYNKRPYLCRGQLLTPVAGRKGRLFVGLKHNSRLEQWPIHQLVATVFIGPRPVGAECCHGDGDHLNNHVENLRWDTRSSNERDKRLHGTNPQINKTHCPQGHEYTPENTRISRQGWRSCKICSRERCAARAGQASPPQPRAEHSALATERKRRVVDMTRAGVAIPEIARTLGIHPRTVSQYRAACRDLITSGDKS